MSTTTLPTSPGLVSLWNRWSLLAVFALLAVPTIIRVGERAWTSEAQGAGPLLLATGGWLLWRDLQPLPRQPGKLGITLTLLIPALVLYVFGAAYDFVTFEAAGLFGAGIAILYDRFGAQLRLHWFPLLYLALTIPPPGTLIDSLTAPLKQFVSLVATHGLSAAGLPVEREGVTIFIAQYQLLVEDACSGLNSLIGLSAVTLLYIYLMRGQIWWYLLLVWMVSLPIAIAANIVRIAVLVLITYFFGNEAGQGFLHVGAGLVLFVTALIMVAGFDGVFMALRRRLRATH